jgi:AAA+ superfamily predicted ATPase
MSVGIFDDVREFPDSDARTRYSSLIGLDSTKIRLVKEASILVDPTALEKWSSGKHGTRLPVLDHYANRPPLFIFYGDVGTGKTALAESFGDELSRRLDLPVTTYSLSLTARGSGAVGEMTTLLSTAFNEIRQSARKATNGGRPSGVSILMIDEGDAIAQSRELSQMHHEDRAGVNTIIRGIDDIAENRLPVLVVLCTNRLSAIDPAIKRRAASTFEFKRPCEDRRTQIIGSALNGAGLRDGTVSQIAKLTGPKEGRDYGCSYSDLTHRLLPTFVLDAYPDAPLIDARLLELAGEFIPSPRFEDTKSE